jgi:response regulator RpfG family c-di-GMP phosphodiesterase
MSTSAQLPVVLYVDDEENLLLAVKRQQRRYLDLETASDPRAALELVRGARSFSVVVSDLQMPGMDGVEFLKSVREIRPDTTRIMLTGNADLEAAQRAVNDGHVFRFMTKPCPPETLREAVYAGARIHELVVAERTLLERTLRGAVEVLTQTLALVNPEAFGRAARIRRAVTTLVQRMGLADPWQYEVAGMLSTLGVVSVPPEVAQKAYRGQPLSPDEREMLAESPAVASRLLGEIPRLEHVAEFVRLQGADFRPADGAEAPPLGARVLRVALDFDALRMRGQSVGEAALGLRRAPEGTYDPDVIAHVDQLGVTEGLSKEMEIRVAAMRVGMVVVNPVMTEEGLLVVAAGHEVTESLLNRLRNWTRAGTHVICEPIRVVVSEGPAR